MRKRMLSPDFFTDEDVVSCCPLARLAFQGLWCVADREGRLEDRPKQLKMKILPADDADMDALLSELAAAGLIVRYQVGGGRYIAIPGLGKHQRFHVKESASTIPAPANTEVTRPNTTQDGASREKVGARTNLAGERCPESESESESETETGGEELATSSDDSGAGGAAAAHASPPPCRLGPSGAGAQPPAASPGASPPRRGFKPPPGKQASVEQLRMLAEMAVERGTTLKAQAEALGLVGLAAIRAQHVTPLRQRLEALERVGGPLGGPPVIWRDVKVRLEAGDVRGAVASIRSLPEGSAREPLWDRLEHYFADRLPRDVGPQEVMEAAGVERVRQAPQRVWALIERIRGGDRSMLPPPLPDDWRQQGGPLVSAICAAILAKGNGSSQQLRDRLQGIVDAMDLAALRGMHAELCPGGAP